MIEILIASSVLLWLVVVGNVFLTLALVRRLNASAAVDESPFGGLKVGEQVPDFISETLDGEVVSKSKFAKKSVVLLFISTECGPCRDILPSYEAISVQAKKSGVEFVIVSLDDVKKTGRLIKELNIGLPVLVAPRERNPFMKDYKISGTPSYYLIDKEGRLQSAGFPSLDWAEWKSLTESWGYRENYLQRLSTNA